MTGCPPRANVDGSTTKWAAHDIPDQRGRRYVVTGANSGLGAVAAGALAGAGAHEARAAGSWDLSSRLTGVSFPIA